MNIWWIGLLVLLSDGMMVLMFMFMVSVYLSERPSSVCTEDCEQGRNCTCKFNSMTDETPQRSDIRVDKNGKMEVYKEGTWQ